MRFALSNNELTEASPGLKGICPGCAQSVIAKCGQQRIHHWAHANNKECDSWSEPETLWHRSWKNHFSAGWQEKFLTDERTGEKHVADVRTSHGLVIEFQHSYIDPRERNTRESFYGNMIWVVDGTRLKNDYPRFLKGIKEFRLVGKQRSGMYKIRDISEYFPSAWLDSSVSVVFDFRGNEIITEPNDLRHHLYWLFPARCGADAFVFLMSRKVFVNATIDGKLIPWAEKQIDNIKQVNLELQDLQSKIAQQQLNIGFNNLTRGSMYRRRGRRL